MERQMSLPAVQTLPAFLSHTHTHRLPFVYRHHLHHLSLLSCCCSASCIMQTGHPYGDSNNNNNSSNNSHNNAAPYPMSSQAGPASLSVSPALMSSSSSSSSSSAAAQNGSATASQIHRLSAPQHHPFNHHVNHQMMHPVKQQRDRMQCQQQQQQNRVHGQSGRSEQLYCCKCKHPITDRHLLQALGQYWHEDCLKCHLCECRLGEVGSTLFQKADMILCKRDYLRMFGSTGMCSACNKPIPAFEMVMRARNNNYHLECFACEICKNRFCVGDRFYLSLDNRVLCEQDMNPNKKTAK